MTILSEKSSGEGSTLLVDVSFRVESDWFSTNVFIQREKFSKVLQVFAWNVSKIFHIGALKGKKVRRERYRYHQQEENSKRSGKKTIYGE